MVEKQIKCLKCGSTALLPNNKGFNLEQAVLGRFVLGNIGLLAGTIGSNKVKITCLSCGYEWCPIDVAKKAAKEKKRQENIEFLFEHPILSAIFFLGILTFFSWDSGILGELMDTFYNYIVSLKNKLIAWLQWSI
ncbi:hypothetical protein MHK_009177 [Candidatus Magnetomorum sp. HK-1]|nr:hypothetical protein MHK_009177 [Candidatus Magnetomorum sp. HK-1]